MMLSRVSSSKKRRLVTSIHRSIVRYNSTVELHSEVLPSNNSKNHTVFLHGLLGNGRNLKTFAKQACKASDSTGYLMDLRGHGQSRISDAQLQQTHSFASCVEDVASATQSIPVTSIVGHSWGGRMALQYAATSPSDSLERVWLLDTVPGKGENKRADGRCTCLPNLRLILTFPVLPLPNTFNSQ